MTKESNHDESQKSEIRNQKSEIPIPNPQSLIPSPQSPLPSRGVVLLVVLALLALFALIAVAFVVLSGQAQRSAQEHRADRAGRAAPAAQAKTLLQQAAMQVFRGPDPQSTRLRDGRPQPAGNHVRQRPDYRDDHQRPSCFEQDVPTVDRPDGSGHTDQSAYPVRRLRADDHRPSTTTPGYGQSTRIVGGNFGVTPPTLQIMAFPDGTVPQCRYDVHHQRRAVQRHGVRV